jgi:signal transduction histidine kinase
MYSIAYGIILILLVGVVTDVTAVENADISTLSLPQLKARLFQIDADLARLARFSLHSGVGPIGHRSNSYTNSAHTEWVQVDLDSNRPFDEIVLVPSICHDMKRGFLAAAFPLEFRVLAGQGTNTQGRVLATFGLHDHLLPRIAPLVIPCPATTASWVRLEATQLSPRAFDGQYSLELAELMVFNRQDNIALKKSVRSSSTSSCVYSTARHLSYTVDGFLSYLMHSGQGKQSIAYVSQPLTEKRPSFTLDLGAPYPLDRVNLHAVEVDDVFPQSLPYDFCLPDHILIEGANQSDFGDAVPLVTFLSQSPYDRNPLIMLRFPETRCRYVRLTSLVPDPKKNDINSKTPIGFAEIEIFSGGTNVALGKVFDVNFKQGKGGRSLSALTDGANFFGTILATREWLEQLAQRHDRETEHVVIAAELNHRYARQNVILQRMTWLAALLVVGLVFVILVDRLLRMRQAAWIKERLAADLHDELGANLHTIGLLSDLAEDAKETPEERSIWHQRIRAITERSGMAVRHCSNMLQADGIYTALVPDMKRTSERIMAKFDQNIVITGEEHIRQLKPSTCFDLLLFYKECLVNISRHSGATQFHTELTATEKELCLSVTDNGRGLAESGTKRIPSSLSRRARLLGATIHVENPVTGGTRITLCLKTRRWGYPRK